jgi:hypothetical protein
MVSTRYVLPLGQPVYSGIQTGLSGTPQIYFQSVMIAYNQPMNILGRRRFRPEIAHVNERRQ